MTSSRRRLIAAVAMVCLTAACGPKTDIQVGLKDYNTDVVYGDKKKPLPPPPIAGATLTPGFPGFIQPPPARVTVPPAVTVPPTVPAACPEAGVAVIPPAAALDLSGPPKPGVYRYRNSGTVKIGDQTTKVGDESTRTIAVVDDDPQQPSWTVAIASGTSVTTTTYVMRRLIPGGNLDGIYLTQVVTRDGDSAPQEFTPTGLGLRIFAVPAQIAATWETVATDPLHGTTIRLTATMTERRRVDACGDLVEGWTVRVLGDIIGAAPAMKTLKIDANYVTVPQLGGLIAADTVHLTGTDAGVEIDQYVDSILATLEPSPAPAG